MILRLGNISPVFGFSPMDSLSTSVGQARISKDGKVAPLADFATDLDTLIANEFITNADPFYAKNPIGNMFSADVVRVNNWSGPETIGARTLFNNGKTNQVFISVELHRLNGDTDALKKLFDFVLNKEFNW